MVEDQTPFLFSEKSGFFMHHRGVNAIQKKIEIALCRQETIVVSLMEIQIIIFIFLGDNNNEL
jgi:hypothetical protein